MQGEILLRMGLPAVVSVESENVLDPPPNSHHMTIVGSRSTAN